MNEEINLIQIVSKKERRIKHENRKCSTHTSTD